MRLTSEDLPKFCLSVAANYLIVHGFHEIFRTLLIAALVEEGELRSNSQYVSEF